MSPPLFRRYNILPFFPTFILTGYGNDDFNLRQQSVAEGKFYTSIIWEVGSYRPISAQGWLNRVYL